MGGSACIIIINGGKAYAAVEELADRFNQVNTYHLEAAITVSCNLVPYVSQYLHTSNKYLPEDYMHPIINLHTRIINELYIVQKADAQSLVDELAKELFAASERVGTVL